jgi:hypothetical protein
VGLTPIIHLVRVFDSKTHCGQIDIGAIYSVKPLQSLVNNSRPYHRPTLMSTAATNGFVSIFGKGTYELLDNQGHTFSIPILFCPTLDETLIYPNHICRSSHDHYQKFNTDHNIASDSGCLSLSSTSGLAWCRVPLIRSSNGLWYISRVLPGAEETARSPGIAGHLRGLTSLEQHIPAFQSLTNDSDGLSDAILHSLSGVATAELWHHCLGHPGITQLAHLQHHATGLPKDISLHPFRSCQICMDARHHCTPVWRTDITPVQPGNRFHVNFGFMRASNSSFGPSAKTDSRVVQSHDGFLAYLLISDAATQYSWCFLPTPKNPRLLLCDCFFNVFAALPANGPFGLTKVAS